MSTSRATQTPSSSEDEKPEREKYLEEVVLGLEHQVDELRDRSTRLFRENQAHHRAVSILQGERKWYRALLLALSAKTGQNWIELEGAQNFDGDGIELAFASDLLGQTRIVKWDWHRT
jgi:acetyl-CoA carboxylase alpha subunit